MTNTVEQLINGRDHEVIAAVRLAIFRWMTDTPNGPDLSRLLGLEGRARARRAWRDALLRQAAAPLPGSTWARAKALAAHVRAFESRRWPRWRLLGAPDDAGEIDRLLFEARRIDEIPSTPRQLFNVLAD